jgi:hypothetical protein
MKIQPLPTAHFFYIHSSFSPRFFKGVILWTSQQNLKKELVSSFFIYAYFSSSFLFLNSFLWLIDKSIGL